MKAQELRLGNLLWNPVQEIPVPVDIRMLNDIYYYNKVKKEHGWQPIPLTEQWLIDFGFEESKTKSPRFFKKGTIRVLKWKTNDFAELKIYRSIVGYIKVKSVHQLQNIYFALTREELQL